MEQQDAIHDIRNRLAILHTDQSKMSGMLSGKLDQISRELADTRLCTAKIQAQLDEARRDVNVLFTRTGSHRDELNEIHRIHAKEEGTKAEQKKMIAVVAAVVSIIVSAVLSGLARLITK